MKQSLYRVVSVKVVGHAEGETLSGGRFRTARFEVVVADKHREGQQTREGGYRRLVEAFGAEVGVALSAEWSDYVHDHAI